MREECSAGDVPPDYKQTEVGVIPEDWDIEPLRCDVTLFSGQHVLAQHCNTSGDGVPYLTGPADFPNGKIQQTKFTNRPTTLCKAGDILVTVKGSGSGTLVEADDSYCISRQLMAIRVKEWNAKFLFYSLLYNASKIKTSSTGLIPGLSRFDILDQEIPLPPTLAEQESIAEALSDADALIESLEQLINKKRQIKQGAMQELLTGKRRLSGFSGEWKVKRFGEIVQPRKERIDPRRTAVQDFCIELEHIEQGTGCLVGYTATEESSSLKSIFQKEDVLFGKLRAYLRKYWLANRDGICSTEIWVLVAKRSLLTPHFLFQLVQVDSFVETASLAYGTHMPRSDWNVVKNYEVYLPPLEEQEAIATILSDMDSEITALEEKLAKARQIKQGMMQELLTGRIRLI